MSEKKCIKIAKELGISSDITTRLDNSYYAMMARCYNEENRNFKNYGGRGITVCGEWRDDKKAFIKWALINGYSYGLSIDRKDVNGNYCSENCKWSTGYEQARNTRRNVYIKFNGNRYAITDLAKILGVDLKILSPLAKKGIELRKEV